MNETKRNETESVYPALSPDCLECLARDVMEICKNLIVDNEELKALIGILLLCKPISKVVIEQNMNTGIEVENNERNKKK